MTPRGTTKAKAGKSQGGVLRVNCRVLCTAALPAKVAKLDVSVRECTPAATHAVPLAREFGCCFWGEQCTPQTQHMCRGRRGTGTTLLAVIPARASPSLSMAERALLFFPLVKPDGWQVLRKTEPDISRERAVTLLLQACKSRVEKHPSPAMQPSDI